MWPWPGLCLVRRSAPAVLSTHETPVPATLQSASMSVEFYAATPDPRYGMGGAPGCMRSSPAGNGAYSGLNAVHQSVTSLAVMEGRAGSRLGSARNAPAWPNSWWAGAPGAAPVSHANGLVMSFPQHPNYK